MRKPADAPTQVAVTLYYLSDGGRMRKSANSFGLASCTVSFIVERVTKAISKNLVTQYSTVPTTVEVVEELVSKVYAERDFPQCIRASDGTHIPVKKPLDCSTDYINRTGFYSLNVQDYVDAHYCFIDVNSESLLSLALPYYFEMASFRLVLR